MCKYGARTPGRACTGPRVRCTDRSVWRGEEERGPGRARPPARPHTCVIYICVYYLHRYLIDISTAGCNLDRLARV